MTRPLIFSALVLVLSACAPAAQGVPAASPAREEFRVEYLVAAPSRISAPGEAVYMSWDISGPHYQLELLGDDGIRLTDLIGITSIVVYPQGDTTYTLWAYAEGAASSAQASVSVAP